MKCFIKKIPVQEKISLKLFQTAQIFSAGSFCSSNMISYIRLFLPTIFLHLMSVFVLLVCLLSRVSAAVLRYFYSLHSGFVSHSVYLVSDISVPYSLDFLILCSTLFLFYLSWWWFYVNFMFLSYLCCMLWRILSMISSLSINWIYIYFRNTHYGGNHICNIAKKPFGK